MAIILPLNPTTSPSSVQLPVASPDPSGADDRWLPRQRLRFPMIFIFQQILSKQQISSTPIQQMMMTTMIKTIIDDAIYDLSAAADESDDDDDDDDNGSGDDDDNNNNTNINYNNSCNKRSETT